MSICSALFSRIFALALVASAVTGRTQTCDEPFRGTSQDAQKVYRRTFNFNDADDLRTLRVFINTYEKPDGVKFIFDNATVVDEFWFGKKGCKKTKGLQTAIEPPTGRSLSQCVEGPLVWANLTNPQAQVGQSGLFEVPELPKGFPFPSEFVNEGQFRGLLTLPPHTCSATLEFQTGPGTTAGLSAWDAKLDCPDGTVTVAKAVAASADTCSIDGAIQLKAAPSNPSKPYHYEWSGPKGFRSQLQNPVVRNATGENLGTYVVCASSSANDLCKSCDFVDVSAFKPTLSAKIRRPTECQKGSIDLHVEGGYAPYTYFWSNQKTTEDLKDLGPGEYTVEVEDSRGCAVDASFPLEQHTTSSTPKFPNAFTPGNNDELNQVFRIVPNDDLEVNLAVFRVFNRWGALVYDDAVRASWDGKDRSGQDLPEDTYVYHVVYNIDGCPRRYEKRGDILLLR